MNSNSVALVNVEHPTLEIIIEENINGALLAAMRLWEQATQEAREAEEERTSRLRQLMN